MWPRKEGLRAFGFGDPGPMRERLTALALAGTKVATAGVLSHEYVDEPVEVVGERQAMLDNNDEVCAIIEITRVEPYRFRDVPWEFADAEGEGFESIEQWRAGHAAYYAKHDVLVDDKSVFVCVWFRVVETRG